MKPVHACIYIPADTPCSAASVAQRLAHCERRGYRLHAVLRDWTRVERALTAGQASVVVFVSAAEPAQQPNTRNPGSLRRNGRDATVRLPTRREVHRVLFENGTPPKGIDPETISAARRIARALNERSAS